MVPEWKQASLRDLVEIKHGYAFEGEFFRDAPPGDILLTPGNFAIGGGFKDDKLKYYSGPVPRDFVLEPGDLLITMTDLSKNTDTLGFPMRVPKPLGPSRFLHNQRLGRIVIRPQADIDKDYLYYVLCSKEYRDEVLASATGTTVKHTAPSRVGAFKLALPSRVEQTAIGQALSVLDKKIDLNQRMSETLEAMARALFKSWFVDFDPVRAKAEGRDTGLPEPLADLFPARLVDSEIGPIPEGWEVGVLAQALTELEIGSRPKGGVAVYSHGVPSIGAESIVGLGIFDYSKTKYVPREYFDGMTRGHIKSRDILLYKDGGRPGEFEPHLTLVGDGFPFETAAINEHVYRLRSTPHVGQEFLFFWLSSDLVMEQMRIKGTGVAVPGLNSTQVRSLTTLLPSAEVTGVFTRHVEPYIARVLAACNESRVLAETRDTLLPKLISGEIRVKLAEHTVEAAVG